MPPLLKVVMEASCIQVVSLFSRFHIISYLSSLFSTFFHLLSFYHLLFLSIAIIFTLHYHLLPFLIVFHLLSSPILLSSPLSIYCHYFHPSLSSPTFPHCFPPSFISYPSNHLLFLSIVIIFTLHYHLLSFLIVFHLLSSPILLSSPLSIYCHYFHPSLSSPTFPHCFPPGDDSEG